MQTYEIPNIITVTHEAYDIELVQQIANIEASIQTLDAWHAKTITDMLTQDIYHCWAVIDSHEKEDIHILAYCIWSKVFEVIEILRIGTHPEHRRQGLAYGLIRALQKYSSRKNLPEPAQKILLEVREDNSAAIKLYEKMGFEVIDRRRNYYKNIVIGNIESINTTCDALIMQYKAN